MPRIRTLKPEFWADEKLAPMAPIDRLVFLGLISFADDAGRLVDNVKAIDGFIFPESVDTSRESLARFTENGRVVRYESESGQRLIQIANWKKHQKIDHPSKYVLPGPPRRSSRDPRESLGESVAKSSRSDLGPRTSTSTSTEEQFKSGKLDPERGESPSTAAPPAPLFASLTELLAASATVAAWWKRYYPRDLADRARRDDVGQQLLASLNGGAVLAGERIQAYSLERLETKCREVLTEGVRDRDKAIVVLLKKLGDTSDGSAPGQVAAVTDAEDAERDAGAVARELAAAKAWLETHPEIVAAIATHLERDGFIADSDVPALQSAWRIGWDAAVLRAHRARASPDPDAAKNPATP